MAKFNLQDLLNERSKETKKEEIKQIFLDLDEIIPSENNFYNTKDIFNLKQNIALVGVLQPLLVKKQDNGKYLLLAGHRRRLACMELVEEGMEEFRKLPCIIKDIDITEDAAEKEDIDIILDQLTLIFANNFRDKSEWEKMQEILQTEVLISELKKKVGLKGRVRSILSQYTNIKEAQIARYKAINNNLINEFKERFESNEINVSIAYELSGLDEEYQKRAYSQYIQNEKISLNDVREIKKQEEVEKQIEGQVSLEDLEEVSSSLESVTIEHIDQGTDIDTIEPNDHEINVEEPKIEYFVVAEDEGVIETIESQTDNIDSTEDKEESERQENDVIYQNMNQKVQEVQKVLIKYRKYYEDDKKAGAREDTIKEKEIIKDALEFYLESIRFE